MTFVWIFRLYLEFSLFRCYLFKIWNNLLILFCPFSLLNFRFISIPILHCFSYCSYGQYKEKTRIKDTLQVVLILGICIFVIVMNISCFVLDLHADAHQVTFRKRRIIIQKILTSPTVFTLPECRIYKIWSSRHQIKNISVSRYQTYTTLLSRQQWEASTLPHDHRSTAVTNYLLCANFAIYSLSHVFRGGRGEHLQICLTLHHCVYIVVLSHEAVYIFSAWLLVTGHRKKSSYYWILLILPDKTAWYICQSSSVFIWRKSSWILNYSFIYCWFSRPSNPLLMAVNWMSNNL